jgi:hypothetical protein
MKALHRGRFITLLSHFHQTSCIAPSVLKASTHTSYLASIKFIKIASFQSLNKNKRYSVPSVRP